MEYVSKRFVADEPFVLTGQFWIFGDSYQNLLLLTLSVIWVYGKKFAYENTKRVYILRIDTINLLQKE